jgi:hypothetical protein
MDITQAVVERLDHDQVRIYLNPVLLTARVNVIDNRPVLVELTIHNDAGITASSLADLPMRGITMLAASAVFGAEESIYRRLATPTAVGVRSWTAEHYRRVSQVAAWAARSKRRGGPAVCVAEFWDVHERTARRWLAEASRLEADAPDEQPRQARTEESC